MADLNNLGVAAAAALVGLVAAWASTRTLIGVLRKAQLLDVPNQRSSHKVPTPRGGGLGILIGVAAAVAVAAIAGAATPPTPILLGGVAMAALGFADDRLELSARLRFAVQIAIAALTVVALGGMTTAPLPPPFDNVSLGALSGPLTVFWIVAVVNLYNFLDGIDGYAGAQGVLGGLVLAACFPQTALLAFGLGVAGACAGFLFHNWQPASIFMGDIGACLLGYLFATAPLQLAPDARAQGVLCVALALWFFLADGALTIFRRLAAGERVWEAHRTHLYQRMTRTGLSHAQVVIRVGFLALPVALAVVWARRSDDPTSYWTALAAAAAAVGVFFLWTSYRERSSEAEPQRRQAASTPGGEI